MLGPRGSKADLTLPCLLCLNGRCSAREDRKRGDLATVPLVPQWTLLRRSSRPFDAPLVSAHRLKRIAADPGLRHKLQKHNSRQLTRVYPKGSRFSSTNLSGHDFADAHMLGCQVRARARAPAATDELERRLPRAGGTVPFRASTPLL